MQKSFTEFSLQQLSALLDSREISSVELVQSLIEYIKKTEPAIGAFALLTPEHALKQAQKSDERRKKGKQVNIIDGIPFGVKDIFDTKGILTEAGSEIYKGRVPEKDSRVVELLQKNGAVLLGKTITTEFADGHPPSTKNPWNPHHTPGGSSTGSAVAVASRMLPYALGTQTVGSVLRPAAYNGIVGLKPTFGLISRTGIVPQSQSCDTVGIFTKSVNDAWLVLQSIYGYDSSDKQSSEKSNSVTPKNQSIISAVKPRIGFLKDYFIQESEEEVRESTLDAIGRIANNGGSVEEVSLNINFPEGYKAQRVIQQSEMAEWHEHLYLKYSGLYKAVTLEYIRSGFPHTAIDYIRAKSIRTEMQFKALDALKSFDVLLSPTASGLPPSDLSRTGDTRFQSPWSFTGFPSIALPNGISSEGLPLSIQVIGKPFEEEKLLEVAQWIEAILGRLPSPIQD